MKIWVVRIVGRPWLIQLLGPVLAPGHLLISVARSVTRSIILVRQD